MMAAPDLDPALADRLERLVDTDPVACCRDLRDAADAIADEPAFRQALARHEALADERRLTVLALLSRRGELCACEIQAALGLTHATVSHHMGRLRDAGLVEAHRRGRWTYYRLAEEAEPLIP